MAEPQAESEVWRSLLSGEFSWEKDRRRFRLLPGSKRCKNCLAPLKGLGAFFARLVGRGPYERNPRFCNF